MRLPRPFGWLLWLIVVLLVLLLLFADNIQARRWLSLECGGGGGLGPSRAPSAMMVDAESSEPPGSGGGKKGKKRGSSASKGGKKRSSSSPSPVVSTKKHSLEAPLGSISATSNDDDAFQDQDEKRKAGAFFPRGKKHKGKKRLKIRRVKPKSTAAEHTMKPDNMSQLKSDADDTAKKKKKKGKKRYKVRLKKDRNGRLSKEEELENVDVGSDDSKNQQETAVDVAILPSVPKPPRERKSLGKKQKKRAKKDADVGLIPLAAHDKAVTLRSKKKGAKKAKVPADVGMIPRPKSLPEIETTVERASPPKRTRKTAKKRRKSAIGESRENGTGTVEEVTIDQREIAAENSGGDIAMMREESTWEDPPDALASSLTQAAETPNDVLVVSSASLGATDDAEQAGATEEVNEDVEPNKVAGDAVSEVSIADDSTSEDRQETAVLANAVEDGVTSDVLSEEKSVNVQEVDSVERDASVSPAQGDQQEEADQEDLTESISIEDKSTTKTVQDDGEVEETGETAEVNAATEDGEVVEDDVATEDGEVAEDDAATEDGEVAEDGATIEDGETAEDGAVSENSEAAEMDSVGENVVEAAEMDSVGENVVEEDGGVHGDDETVLENIETLTEEQKPQPAADADADADALQEINESEDATTVDETDESVLNDDPVDDAADVLDEEGETLEMEREADSEKEEAVTPTVAKTEEVSSKSTPFGALDSSVAISPEEDIELEDSETKAETSEEDSLAMEEVEVSGGRPANANAAEEELPFVDTEGAVDGDATEEALEPDGPAHNELSGEEPQHENTEEVIVQMSPQHSFDTISHADEEENDDDEIVENLDVDTPQEVDGGVESEESADDRSHQEADGAIAVAEYDVNVSEESSDAETETQKGETLIEQEQVDAQKGEADAPSDINEPQAEEDEPVARPLISELDTIQAAVDVATDQETHGEDVLESVPGRTNAKVDPRPILAKSTPRIEIDIGTEALTSCEDANTDIAVSVATWNLAELLVDEEGSKWMRKFRKTKIGGASKGSDIVLISGQECENIKPRRSEGHRSREYRRLMIKMLGRDYVPLALHSLGGIQFGLFCKRSILHEIEFCSLADVTVGIGNVFHNKGAIGAFVQMKARMSDDDNHNSRRSKSLKLLFITAHMAAHVKKVDARNEDFWRIVSELEAQTPPQFLTPNKRGGDADGLSTEETHSSYLLDSMDRVFYCGDLNYRLDLPREVAEQQVGKINDLLSFEDQESLKEADQIRQSLLLHDQLKRVIAEGTAFPGFAEGKITFPPTFKFDKGSKDYDTSHKQRIPSWTDRVLFKPFGVRVLEYTSEQDSVHSDHRPVHATFRVSALGRELPHTISNGKVSTRKRRRSSEAPESSCKPNPRE